MVIALFPQKAFAAESNSFDQDMAQYLADASSTRGFEVNQDDINQSLAQYGMTTDDFTSVEEIKSFLGVVIKADMSNLNDIYQSYDLDQSTLADVLSGYGEDLNDYVFLDDLDNALTLYTGNGADNQGSEIGSNLDLTQIMSIFSQSGITDSEIQNLKDYYTSMEDYLSGADVQKQLENLSTRMMTLGQTLIEKGTADKNYQPSEEEINQLVSAYDEMLSIMKVKVAFSLSQNGSDTPISFTELLKMNDMGEANLKLQLFTADSKLLADMVLQGDPGKSGLGEILGEVSGTNSDHSTVKGGTLPKTASDNLSNTVLGLFVATAGILIYRKVRNDKSETIKEQA